MSRLYRPTRYGVAWARGRCFSTGKRRFVTESAALSELARIMTRSIVGERLRRKVESGVYECESCGGWHLTSQPWEGKVVG